MKPEHIKQQRQKAVRRLYKRRREIWKKMHDLGYIPLEKPVRHGWYKELVITAKVERYKNQKAILEVYNKVEKWYWGRTKQEAQKAWDNQTSLYLIYNGLPTLSKRQYNKLSPKAQAICIPYYYRTARKKLKTRFYIKIPKGAYRIKFSRAYVTHAKRIDPALESESKLIEQQLLKHGYFQANRAFYPWNDHYWKGVDFKKEKRQAAKKLNQLKRQAVKDLIKDKTLWEIN